MKPACAVVFSFAVFLSVTGLAQQQAPPANQSGLSGGAAQEQTPAQQSISAAQLQIKNDAKKPQAYNELALGFLRRTRETADPKYLQDADAALALGLTLEPNDFQMQRTQVALLLARQKWVQAQERATALHRRTPDDVTTYGYLAEAEIALGNYPEAEKNAQWMLNLRPNNTPGLLIGAELRALYGDPRGAVEFLILAYSGTSPTEVEELAWIANRIASIQIESGQLDAAGQTLESAEQLFPQYPRTTENSARLRMAQGRPSDAVQLWTQATSQDIDSHVLYELATAWEAQGQSTEARATYAEFEKAASDAGRATDQSRVDLILMEAGNPATAKDGLKLAQQEIAARQDVWTLDAYSWALYANGRYQEADAAAQKAIAVGIQSTQIFDHAGHIAQKLDHSADAAKYFLLAHHSGLASEDAVGSVANPLKPEEGLNGTPGLTTASNRSTHSASPAIITTKTAAPVFAPVPESSLTPLTTTTDRLIHSAQVGVARSPADSKAYAVLGAAYFQRARETGDVSDYQLAEESLNKSLDLVSADFSADAALETMAEVCMGEHRFSDALTYSQKALTLGTGDVSPFATVGDAYADMGEYDKAGTAYGRLTPREMTLSPRAAYARDSRLAYLKFIAGDTAGATELMKTSVQEGVQAHLPSENLAWLYYELGEFLTQAGDAAAADTAYLAALSTHPGDYRALAALGKLRANNGRYAEAILLYQRAIAVVPMPIFVAELGDLYAKSGNPAEAQKQYALVEYIGLLGHINQVLHNRDLALFYADHDIKLGEALDLAQKEFEVRHDVYTWDALAWALYKNGRLDEAAKASEKAMRFGTQDPLFLFHAGMIAERQGQTEQARASLKEALQINPRFHLVYANEARQRLAALEARGESKDGQENNVREGRENNAQ